MNEILVAHMLGYNLEYYKYYVEYKSGCKDNQYLSFEHYLILSDNLNRFISGEDVYSEYLFYHEDLKVKDYECFELFCKTMHLFPYDLNLLDKYRDCSNCVYFSKGINLKTDEEEYVCGLGINFDDMCDLECHQFNVNEAKDIIRKVRKQVN